jgi:gluconokinase
VTQRALALDLGSSSVRALVFETAGPGELVPVRGAMARRPRHLVPGEPGQATFEADDYLADLVACVDELHSRGDLEGVSDVCLDSQWHSVMALGPGRRALTDVVSWADTRPARPWPGSTAEELEILRQRTGCAFAPMYWTWRLPWLRTMLGSDPDRFLGLSEYVGLKLLDDPSMSVSIASGTGLLATSALTWDPEALRLAGVSPDVLPPLAERDWEGRLAGAWRRRWPELATARWHAALGDGAAANLGVGCDVPHRAAMTVGTSAAVRAIRPLPDTTALPSGLWRYCVDHERALVGAAFSSGGELYAWALALWEGTAETDPAGGGDAGAGPGAGQGAKSSAKSSAGSGGGAGDMVTKLRFGLEVPVGAGSDGVLVLPWHAGTRPPEVPVPASMGAVLHLGLAHTGAHVVSAAVESICFELAAGLDELERDAEQPLEVVVNGGAVERSQWWKLRLAAALGRPTLFSSAPETTARGAAAKALGVDLGPAGVDAQVVEPTEEDMAALMMARRRWTEHYEKLLPIVTNWPG